MGACQLSRGHRGSPQGTVPSPQFQCHPCNSDLGSSCHFHVGSCRVFSSQASAGLCPVPSPVQRATGRPLCSRSPLLPLLDKRGLSKAPNPLTCSQLPSQDTVCRGCPFGLDSFPLHICIATFLQAVPESVPYNHTQLTLIENHTLKWKGCVQEEENEPLSQPICKTKLKVCYIVKCDIA